AQYALTLIRAWDGEARADSGATLVLELTRQALLQRLLGPKLGPDVSIYHWGLSTVFLQNVLKNRWARWLPPGDADFNMTLMKSLEEDRKSTRLNSSHVAISYAVFCLKKKKKKII